MKLCLGSTSTHCRRRGKSPLVGKILIAKRIKAPYLENWWVARVGDICPLIYDKPPPLPPPAIWVEILCTGGHLKDINHPPTCCPCGICQGTSSVWAPWRWMEQTFLPTLGIAFLKAGKGRSCNPRHEEDTRVLERLSIANNLQNPPAMVD